MNERVGPPRRILTEIDPKRAAEDVERYARLAIEFGADDAKVVPAASVVIDERARMKCRVPRCPFWERSSHCSPSAPSPEEMRAVLAKYEMALLIKHNVHPVEDYADRRRSREMSAQHHRKLAEIVGRIEALACHEGYYFAMGFASGSCKKNFCNGKDCEVLTGGDCRFPLIARPSMEGVGIDAFRLAASVGWEIYPIGLSQVDPKDVPCAVTLGLVLIF